MVEPVRITHCTHSFKNLPYHYTAFFVFPDKLWLVNTLKIVGC